MKDKQSNVGEMTIGQLIRSLKPGHVWTIMGCVASLIVGAFVAGKTVEHSEFTKTKKRLEISEAKQEFLGRYLRYMTSIEALGKKPSEKAREQFQRSQDMFVELIRDWWKQQNKPNAPLNPPFRIDKGLDPVENSTIEFSDGTQWRIPILIKAKVLDR